LIIYILYASAFFLLGFCTWIINQTKRTRVQHDICLKTIWVHERDFGFNGVYQQFRAMNDSGCQICCNWYRLRPGILYQHTEVPCHR